MLRRLHALPIVALFTAMSIAPAVQGGPLDLQFGIIDPNAVQGDVFGGAGAISLSSGKALIGAKGDATTGATSGRAYVYDTASGALLRTFENPTPASNDQFGGAVSLSGNLALVGAQNDGFGGAASGVAYLFDVTTGALLRTFANPGPLPNIVDNFGHAVAISGNRALISAIGDDRGATNAGAAYLFDTTTGALLKTFLNPTPGSGDFFGQDVALFGNRALISSSNDDTAALNAGAAYLFDTTTGALLQTFLNPTPEQNNLFGNNDNFGLSVALSGTQLAIGAPNDGVNGFQNGVVYLYDLATGNLLHTLVMPTPFPGDTAEFLGTDIALSDNYVLAGAPERNFGKATTQKDIGAAFLFSALTGSFLQEIDDISPTPGNGLGSTVALDGGAAAIAAPGQLVGTISRGEVFVYQTAAAVPEPGSAMLLLSALVGLMGVGWRRCYRPRGA